MISRRWVTFKKGVGFYKRSADQNLDWLRHNNDALYTLRHCDQDVLGPHLGRDVGLKKYLNLCFIGIHLKNNIVTLDIF